MTVADSVRHLKRSRLLLDRIMGEYREMPGLSLTRRQAARLWGLDGAACEEVLAALVETGFLRRTSTQAFVRSLG